MAVGAVGVMYLAVEFFIGGGHINQTVLAVTLPGLFAYMLAAEEINSGTLEQSQRGAACACKAITVAICVAGSDGRRPRGAKRSA